jgi:hypothetical protein
MSEIKRDYYQVLITAQSGKGKTYSMRNMNPTTTGFINIENKPLPFKNNFKYHKRISDINEVSATLVEYYKNPEINCIIIDSLSAFLDLLLERARATYKGFDIWNHYNTEVGKFLSLIKKSNKEVFVTSHYEVLGIEGNQEKRTKAKGKEWEGLIEKEFTIVMYGDNKFNEDGKPDYFFNLTQEGTSAKCPPEIFGIDVQRIPNDCSIVLDKILEFTGSKVSKKTEKVA